MSAEWTITGLTYDREKAERTLDNNNRQASCSVLFSAQLNVPVLTISWLPRLI